MLKYLLITLNGLGFFIVSNAQTKLVQWNFNNSVTSPSYGSGTLAATGGTVGSSAQGNGSSDPAGSTNNNAFSTATYPAVSSNNKSAGIKLQLNTTGYQSIMLSFDNRNSGSAANTLVVRYSLDDITYTDVPGASYLTMGTNFQTRLADLSGIPSVNNIPSLYLKIVTAFVGASYVGTTVAYGAGTGTIRFDMVTITGISTTCTGSATQSASNMLLTATDAGSMTLAFNRGNGGGCIVLAKQGGPVDAAPSNGTAYNANKQFGSGSQVGTGNFVVHASTTPGSQQFTMTGLTAGSIYYFSIYEYSHTGFCYLPAALGYSAVCNSTVLVPGDMLLIGFDASIGGPDKYILTNLVDLKQGTGFNLVNSRFEAGANASQRTNHWRSGSDNAFDDPTVSTFLYNSPTIIPKGSIISFTLGSSITNININGISTSSFITTNSNFSTGGVLSLSGPDQIYLSSGSFKSFGTVGTDRYNLLQGNVLCGISNGASWVPFPNSVTSANTSTARVSRLPSQINCINLELSSSINGYAYYIGPRTGSKAALIAAFDLPANWATGGGTSADDLPTSATAQFSVSSGNPNGGWKGINTNWFDCKNWEGLAVPDQNTDATIPFTANNPNIDAQLGEQYDSIALANKLNILTGMVTLSGTGKDRLHIYDSLIIHNFGTLRSSGSTANQIDTVLLHGQMIDMNMANISTGLKLGDTCLLVIENNRGNTATTFYLNASTVASPNIVGGLVLNNPNGLQITKGGLETSKQLFLTNGIVSYTDANAFHTIGSACIIKNPANKFGDTDRGWEGSFFNDRVNVKTNSTKDYAAPVGNVANGIYAPVLLGPAATNDRTYAISYVPSSHPNRTDVEGLDHVSEMEYWKIHSDDINSDAKLALYYSPYSHVGDGMMANNDTNMKSLRIAQYYDNGATGYKWRLFGSTPFQTFSFLPGSNVDNGAIHYSQFATKFSADAQYFTFASISSYVSLPVRLIDFQAIAQNKKVKLWWQVAGDEDAANYMIEKSTDGRNFWPWQKALAKHGTGATEYSFYDTDVSAGWYFYRLGITGRDGKTTIHSIKKVYIGNESQIVVSPNPAHDQLNLFLPQANGTAELWDVTGKKCMTAYIGSQRTVSLGVGHLPRGVYLLLYASGATKTTQKVVLR